MIDRIKDKLCPNCNAIMVIDEWDGWIWICCNCDYRGDKATDEEIEENER